MGVGVSVVESRVVTTLSVLVAGSRLIWDSDLGRLGKNVSGTLVSGTLLERTPVISVALVDGSQVVAGWAVRGRPSDDE